MTTWKPFHPPLASLQTKSYCTDWATQTSLFLNSSMLLKISSNIENDLRNYLFRTLIWKFNWISSISSISKVAQKCIWWAPDTAVRCSHAQRRPVALVGGEKLCSGVRNCGPASHVTAISPICLWGTWASAATILTYFTGENPGPVWKGLMISNYVSRLWI